MTARPLVSPVIIRPKHAPNMKLHAVYDCLHADPECTFCEDGCRRCAFHEDQTGCFEMGDVCVFGDYHYEPAEVKHDKG